MIRRLMIGVIAFSALSTAQAEEVDQARITPIPALSLALAPGWQTCEAITRELEGAPFSRNPVARLLCTKVVPASPQIKLAALGPPDRRVMLMISDLGAALTTQQALAKASDTLLADLRAASRAQWERENTSGLRTLDALDVRVDTLGGRKAIVTTITATSKEGMSSFAEQWDVPIDGRTYQLHFTWAKAVDAEALPAVAAIKASVKFD